jgi:hypothetical protein
VRRRPEKGAIAWDSYIRESGFAIERRTVAAGSDEKISVWLYMDAVSKFDFRQPYYMLEKKQGPAFTDHQGLLNPQYSTDISPQAHD